MSDDLTADHAGLAGTHLAQRYADLQQRRQLSLATAAVARYRLIDGSTAGAVLSVTLFTTVLPLIILGFGYFNGFASNVSVGVLFDRQLGLQGALAETVRAAFGSADGLRSSWTLVGLAGFLVWGIPMTITVADIFARAWRREPYPITQRWWRGTCWFVLYLILLALEDQIAFSSDHPAVVQYLLIAVSMVPVWVFWSLTPVLLVRDGARSARFLARAGLAGVAVAAILAVAQRLIFPPMLAGWTGFGPMGVAMAIITWCGVIGIAWVAIACLGAVLWERSAPPDAVIAAQLDVGTRTEGPIPPGDDASGPTVH